MRLLRVTVMTSAAIAIAAFGSAQASDASDRDPSVTVKYGELDLTSNQGVATLYARLRTAARAACASMDTRDLKQRELWKACFDQALTAAVVKVNKSTLTALHERTLKERAS